MNKIDPQRERQRLERLYAEMADEELDKLLRTADELTEIARESLKKELEKRGSRVEFDELQEETEPDHRELVTIAYVRDLQEAMLARGRLASAGIESFVADENLVSLNWFLSNVIGNLRLQVREQDAQAAKEILGQSVPERFDLADGEAPFEQPKCPKCQSVDIQFEGIDRGVGLTAAWLLSLPLHLRRDAWRCNACGAQWQDIEEPEASKLEEENP
jgi:hypothetical protein